MKNNGLQLMNRENTSWKDLLLLLAVFYVMYSSFENYYLTKSVQKSHARLSQRLLLLSGDIEINPGPDCNNYSYGHPYLCGFYRTCLYNIFTGYKLQQDGEDSIQIELNDGFNEAKTIFGDQFNMSDVDISRLIKNHDKFIKTMKKWGQNRGREKRQLYLDTFSIKSWKELSSESRAKHSLDCKECQVSYLKIYSKFPVNTNIFSAETRILDLLIENNQ